MNDEVKKYRRVLLDRKQASWNLEGQKTIQECQSAAARAAASDTGVHLLQLLAIHLEFNVRRPLLGPFEAFNEACEALSYEPAESDFDEILQEAEADFDQRVRVGHQFVHDYILRRGAPGDWATPVTSSAGSALANLKSEIELKKLEIGSRRRRVIPGLRDEVFRQIGYVNIQSRRALKYPLFITSEHAALADLGKAPSTREEVTSCVQALGIVLSQVNHEKLGTELLKAGNSVPEGSINRIEEVLKLRRISAGSAIGALRDLGRLRSLYPAHPSNPDAVAAAERLGLPLEPTNPVEAWERILRILCESMKDLAEALSQIE
jgi:hypothetical protein